MGTPETPGVGDQEEKRIMMTTAAFPVVRYVPEVIVEDGGVTVHCVELGLTGSGPTEELAKERLRQMISAYCRALHRKGGSLLEDTLAKSGIKVSEVSYEPGEEVLAAW